MALEQMHLAAQKICMLVVGKEANTLSTLHGTANCVKSRTRKIVSSNRVSSSLQCRPSHFEVLHWEQWQPPASAPVYCETGGNW